MKTLLPFLLVALACAAPLGAQPLPTDSFDAGIKSWTAESGQAHPGRENGGTLVLRSVKDPDGVAQPGVVAFTASGLEPHRDYELQVSFRFEKALPDKWPWARIAVWEPAAKPIGADATAGRIAEKRIPTQKQASGAVADETWRTVSLPFNPGDLRSVVIRLSNHPKMYDQTHWDDIRIVPLP